MGQKCQQPKEKDNTAAGTIEEYGNNGGILYIPVYILMMGYFSTYTDTKFCYETDCHTSK